MKAASSTSETMMLAGFSPEVSITRSSCRNHVTDKAAAYVGVMNSRVARIVLIVVGVVALLVGGVWIGQGSGVIPGSFMTGDRTWLAIGIFVAAAGVGAIVYGLRRPKSSS